MGYYETAETKRLLRSCDHLHVTDQLHEASIRGSPYSTALRLYCQRSKIPDTPYWSITGRHDMFCGIYNSTGDRFFSGSHVQLVIFGEDERNPRHTMIIGDTFDPSDSVDSTGVLKTFAVCFAGSGSRILSGHNAGIVQICNIGDGRCVETQTRHWNESCKDINAVTTVDPSGNVFLAGGDDTNIRHSSRIPPGVKTFNLACGCSLQFPPKLFDLRALDTGPLAVFTGHVDGITYLDSKVSTMHPTDDECLNLACKVPGLIPSWIDGLALLVTPNQQCFLAFQFEFHFLYTRRIHV
ncbi:unnamed protein product [Echinostoma caproni]|uniref:Uncharacterized protein n=1 Tax=Echinostoma caproni TaxID=27848 RepID=A0A183AZQ7_9TREM|nr:unnamed protein product [Echinostoma caproni]